MDERLKDKRCTIETSFHYCNREAVVERTVRGVHVGYACSLHSKDWMDEKGNPHASVWYGMNLIPGLKPLDHKPSGEIPPDNDHATPLTAAAEWLHACRMLTRSRKEES